MFVKILICSQINFTILFEREREIWNFVREAKLKLDACLMRMNEGVTCGIMLYLWRCEFNECNQRFCFGQEMYQRDNVVFKNLYLFSKK